MDEIPQKVSTKLKYLPEQPGIYIWKNNSEEIIYIGKAVNLKNRIRSYFSGTKDVKTSQLISQIADLDYIIVNSEAEAYILESNLIKKYKPKYNILLKDDKRFPYIKITLFEPFPRIMITRELIKDSSQYYGPYTDAHALRKTLRFLEWIFPLRSCKRQIPKDNIAYTRSCINYQLGKCKAPCVGKITYPEYKKIVSRMHSFFQGKYQEILADLKTDMEQASEALEYENAAKIRDQINQLEIIHKRQSIFQPDAKNLDIIGYYHEENYAVSIVLHLINGKLIHQESYPLMQIEKHSDTDILSSFVKLYYADKEDLPSEILLPFKPDNFNEMNTWLENRLTLPQRGLKVKLLIMAKRNAFQLVEEKKLAHLRKSNRTIYPIQELKEKLKLKKLPRKIVCLDISTIQGRDTVSSVIFFENGKPVKKHYRHFIIRSVDGQNDYASMAETLDRFLREIEKDSAMTPDLIMIDGGKGQLNAAKSIMQNKDLALPLISIAKRIEEVFLPDNQEPIILSKSSSALRLLIKIRDEAHRFAITLHRKRRTKRTLISELENIPGIGEHLKFQLLRQFGSIEAIKAATVEQLTQIKGIGENTAKKIKDTLK